MTGNRGKLTVILAHIHKAQKMPPCAGIWGGRTLFERWGTFSTKRMCSQSWFNKKVNTKVQFPSLDKVVARIYRTHIRPHGKHLTKIQIREPGSLGLHTSSHPLTSKPWASYCYFCPVCKSGNCHSIYIARTELWTASICEDLSKDICNFQLTKMLHNCPAALWE